MGYEFGQIVSPERRAADQRERIAVALERIATALEENAKTTRWVWQELASGRKSQKGKGTN